MNENQEPFFEEEGIFESINRFEEMLKKNSSCFFDLYEFENIVDFYIDQHSFHSAKTAIEKGLKQHPYSTALKLKLAQIYINNGKPSKGLHFLRRIEVIEGSNSEFFLLKGTALNILGRKEEASSAFNKSIELAYEGKEDIIFSIAYSYINTRRYKLAIKYLKLLLEINPKNTMALHELALVYERTEELNKSIEYYKKYIDIEPYAENIWFNLGMVYSNIEKFDKAIEAYDYAIAISPDFVSAYFSKANTYVMQERYDDAVRTYEEIIYIEPDNVQVYTYIGECYEKLQDYKHAIHYYRKSIELDNAYSDAWFGIGMGFYHMDEYASSLKYFMHAKGLDPENPEYWFMLGEAYRKLNILDKSAESYNRAVELDPNDYEAWLSNADIRFIENNVSEAISILNKAYQYNNDISTINYNLAIYYLYNNQDQLAYKYFEKGLSINYNEHSELLTRYPKTSDNKTISQLIRKYKNLS